MELIVLPWNFLIKFIRFLSLSFISYRKCSCWFYIAKKYADLHGKPEGGKKEKKPAEKKQEKPPKKEKPKVKKKYWVYWAISRGKILRMYLKYFIQKDQILRIITSVFIWSREPAHAFPQLLL